MSDDWHARQLSGFLSHTEVDRKTPGRVVDLKLEWLEDIKKGASSLNAYLI